MEIAAISDTHGYDFDLPTADVLVCAGDMTATGRWEQMIAVGEYIKSAAYDHVILVPGNHDLCFEKALELAAYNFPYNFHLLVDQACEYQEHVFYG
jgi:predicted phosphodiesterase